MSLFDPKSFLSTALDGANATKGVPLPIGETIAQVTKIDIVEGQKDNKPWYRFEATFELRDGEYLSKWGVEGAEKATVMQRFLLDVNEGGGIAMGPGRNVKLGRLREAAGVNQPGKSLDQMVGQMVKVSIINRPNPDDPDVIYSEVASVTKA